MPPFFVRYRKRGEKKNWFWGPRFDHIETEDGRIYFDQGRETGPLQTRYRERSEEVFAERKWEQDTLDRLREERRMQREAMRMSRGPGPGPGPDRGGGHGGPLAGGLGGGHGGGHGGPPGGGEGGGGGGGPDEMRGPGAGHGSGFVYGEDHDGGRGGMGGSGEGPGGRGGGFVGRGGGHGGGRGRMPGPSAGPGGPGIQRGHGSDGSEPSIDGEELRPPGAGHGDAHHDYVPSAITDNESSASSDEDDEEEADAIRANGEFDPRHQFNVPPVDNNPHGPAARRVPHDNVASRVTPEGWNPNTGGVAARTAGRGDGGKKSEREKKTKKLDNMVRVVDALTPVTILSRDGQGRLVRVQPRGGKESDKKKKKKNLAPGRILDRDGRGRLVRAQPRG